MDIDLDTIHLGVGKHHGPEDGFCLLEAVAFEAGEPWTDSPKCASRLLADAGRSLNDAIKDQDERDALNGLRRHIIGTAGDGLDDQRSAMAWAFYVNRWVPAWMRLTPSLAEHVTALESVDTTDRVETQRVLDASRPAAAAARDAAGDAAWDAAAAVAGDAAWAAAGAAARDAARDAAAAVAGAAARAAAWAAAWAVAGDAAGAVAALRETSEQLRADFTVVYRAMVMLGKTTEAVAS